jgi:hypothetical protein
VIFIFTPIMSRWGEQALKCSDMENEKQMIQAEKGSSGSQKKMLGKNT